jgi:hypothetical protein
MGRCCFWSRVFLMRDAGCGMESWWPLYGVHVGVIWVVYTGGSWHIMEDRDN